MKWTAYLGPSATRLGRFDSRREAIRSARHSLDEAPYFFLICRRDDTSDTYRRLVIFARDERVLLDTNSWTLGTETTLAEDLL